MQSPTLSEHNRFRFTCPIFNTEVAMRHCVDLRTQVWRGERVTIRRGCQACMISGKCPAARIVSNMAFRRHGEEVEEFASAERVVGRLTAPILEGVMRVVVLESALTHFSVPVIERQLIASARPRIEAQLATAPQRASRRTVTYAVPEGEEPVQRAPVARARPVSDPLLSAAATGDLAAAITAGTAP